MANPRRIIFSSQLVAFATEGSTSFIAVHGLESYGMTTSFSLQSFFELANKSIYEQVEGSPDVQVTTQKKLDGYCPAFLLATRGSSDVTLAARTTKKCTVGLAVHDDAVQAASGIPVRECIMSGMIVGSVGYTFPVEGPFTEDLTLQGTDKYWKSGSFFLTNFTEFIDDVPLAINGSGGINLREDMLFSSSSLTGVGIGFDTNGMVNTNNVTILPPEVDGINASGLNTLQDDGSHNSHLQNISVSADFQNEDIFELGKKTYFARFSNPLIEVNTSIATLATKWDNISANEAGVQGNGNNLANRTIKIRVREGLYLNLGTKNKLANVEYGGGDAGGGNVIVTYNYTNFNDLSVSHPMDVTTALRIPGPVV